MAAPTCVGPDISLFGSVNAALCAAAVFAAGALLFSRGLMGGGDVKLLTAATLWTGPGGTPALLIGTALLGGLLTLALLFSAPRRLRPSGGGRRRKAHAGAVRRRDRRRCAGS